MRLLLILSLLVYALFADSHEKKDHHYYNKDLTYLNLDHDQKKTLKHILKKYRKNIKKYREKKEDIVEKKQDIFSQDDFDATKIEKLNQKLSNKSTELEIKFLKQIHALLSKKQRKKFIEYIDEWEIE